MFQEIIKISHLIQTLWFAVSVRTCSKNFEMVFKTVVSGEDFQNPKIIQKSKLNLNFRNVVLRSLPQRLNNDIPCDCSCEMVTEDCHFYR